MSIIAMIFKTNDISIHLHRTDLNSHKINIQISKTLLILVKLCNIHFWHWQVVKAEHSNWRRLNIMNKAFHRKRSHTEQESLHINYQAISRLYINVTTFSPRPHYYYNHRLAFCRSCFDLCYETTPCHSLSVSPLSSLTRFLWTNQSLSQHVSNSNTVCPT